MLTNKFWMKYFRFFNKSVRGSLRHFLFFYHSTYAIVSKNNLHCWPPDFRKKGSGLGLLRICWELLTVDFEDMIIHVDTYIGGVSKSGIKKGGTWRKLRNPDRTDLDQRVFLDIIDDIVLQWGKFIEIISVSKNEGLR